MCVKYECERGLVIKAYGKLVDYLKEILFSRFTFIFIFHAVFRSR